MRIFRASSQICLTRSPAGVGFRHGSRLAGPNLHAMVVAGSRPCLYHAGRQAALHRVRRRWRGVFCRGCFDKVRGDGAAEPSGKGAPESGAFGFEILQSAGPRGMGLCFRTTQKHGARHGGAGAER